MVDIRITYETLFDLLRREKNREELQKLDKDFYDQVLAYLKEKKQALSKKGDELFVSAEREKLKIQFQNIRRIVKELYERREKKIINMAVNRARTGSDVIDTSNLLPSEKAFFSEQVNLLIKYKDNVLDSIIHLKEFNGNNKEKAEEVKEEEKQEEIQEEDEKPVVEEEKETKPSETEEVTNELKKIKITSSLPEFVGTQGEVLGPFEEGDEIELEPAIADILVKKGSAEVV